MLSRIDATSSSKIKTSHESLSTKSERLIITAYVITGITGCVFIALGLTGTFGNSEGINFIAVVSGGGALTLISMGGIASLSLGKSTKTLLSNVEREPAPSLVYPVSSSEASKDDLRLYLSELAKKIKVTPQYDIFRSTSLDNHVNQLCPYVYFGSYRGFLSVDPEFIIQHSMTDRNLDMRSVTSYDEMQREISLDRKGCSDKNIKVVVSIAKACPSKVEHWATFQPNLDSIKRIKFLSDSADYPNWTEIEPHLEAIFLEIDDAIQAKGKKNIFVYCVKGDSSGPAVMCAYLMNRCKVTLNQALNYIQTVCSAASWLMPFQKSGLEKYEKSLSKPS